MFAFDYNNCLFLVQSNQNKSENISLQSRLAQLQNLQNLLITLTDFHESYEVENMSVSTKCLHNLPFSLLASI